MIISRWNAYEPAISGFGKYHACSLCRPSGRFLEGHHKKYPNLEGLTVPSGKALKDTRTPTASPLLLPARHREIDRFVDKVTFGRTPEVSLQTSPVFSACVFRFPQIWLAR